MASTLTKAAVAKPILKPATTSKGHGENILSMSYFPDGQRMISGSWDKTARQWDRKAGKETEEARGVCEERVYAVAVSRDGRWVITAGGDLYSGELKACEVETGIVKTFESHSEQINCIDISADSTLLASGPNNWAARIWNLDTGKLVAGPFKSATSMGAVRFSTDSKKLAIKLYGEGLGCPNTEIGREHRGIQWTKNHVCASILDKQKQKHHLRSTSLTHRRWRLSELPSKDMAPNLSPV